MSKLLIVSDIHIYDYPQRNPREKGRLLQSRIVAQNIIDAGKREGADTIVIAGDVVEKAVNRPYIESEVKLFLDTVMSSFKDGYIIWGNHDQDNKSNNQDFTDSSLAVMLPSNLYYAHEKIINIEGIKIGFCNWEPVFDLSWIPDKVDILITHATINYSNDGGIKSQKLDESKFDLAICGDIHKAATTGKYVSIGVPQKCKMGDSDKATGVILDITKKNWKWVNLDPENKLLKLVYTDDKDKEGYDFKSNTYFVYQAPSLTIKGQDGEVKISGWNEINEMIKEIISKANLQELHSIILRDADKLETAIDFDFLITRLQISNWRSIESLDLQFKDHDKIYISGPNGSGKSSIMGALLIAFTGSRWMKEFIQFGKNETNLIVDFVYKKVNYQIQRGRKGNKPTWKLLIEGAEQKYGNLDAFDTDIQKRFPFVPYLEKTMIFTNENSIFPGTLSSDEVVDVISKFSGLDKISDYNLVAENKLKKLVEEESKLSTDLEVEKGRIEWIDQKLQLIKLPVENKSDLENQLRDLENLHADWMKWNKYSSSISGLSGKINALQEQIDEKINALNNTKDPGSSSELEAKIESIDRKINELGDIKIRYEKAKLEEDAIKREGATLKDKLEKLTRSGLCPVCGSVMKTPEEHKKEIEDKLEQLRSDWVKKNKEVKEKEAQKNKAQETLDKLNQQKREYQNKISEIYVARERINSLKNDIRSGKEKIETYKKEIDNIPKVEKVTLPDNFNETQSRIRMKIETWSAWESYNNDREKSTKSAEEIKKKMEVLGKKRSVVERYYRITGPGGEIYEEVIKKFATTFSDNLVKYDVGLETWRGKQRLKIDPYYNNGSNWVGLKSCSSGQKGVVGVHFLSKIINGRIGALVMDETFAKLSPDTFEIVMETLQKMDIGLVMLSAHQESVPNFYNKKMNLQLIDGKTQVGC